MRVEKAASGPVCRYFGGKWKCADWIVSIMPDHQLYCELFGGMGSVLLHKPKSRAEVFNDRNGEVVNLFRVLTDPDKLKELVQRVAITPYSRDLHAQAWKDWKACNWQSDVERAWLFLVCSHMSIGSAATNERRRMPGFEARLLTDKKLDHIQVDPWFNLPEKLLDVARRFAGVTVENRDWSKLFDIYDGAESSLFYLDPPYICGYGYAEAFTLEDHERLLARITKSKSMVMLSGYESDLYRDTLKDWAVFHKKSYNLQNQVRTECLWLNPLCHEAWERESGTNALIRACM